LPTFQSQIELFAERAEMSNYFDAKTNEIYGLVRKRKKSPWLKNCLECRKKGTLANIYYSSPKNT
jgi:hypothetical protein